MNHALKIESNFQHEFGVKSDDNQNTIYYFEAAVDKKRDRDPQDRGEHHKDYKTTGDPVITLIETFRGTIIEDLNEKTYPLSF